MFCCVDDVLFVLLLLLFVCCCLSGELGLLAGQQLLALDLGGVGDRGFAELGVDLSVELLLRLKQLVVLLLPGVLDLGVLGDDGPAEADHGHHDKHDDLERINFLGGRDEGDVSGVLETELVSLVVSFHHGVGDDNQSAPPQGDEIHDHERGVGGDLLDNGVQILDNDTGDEMSEAENGEVDPETGTASAFPAVPENFHALEGRVITHFSEHRVLRDPGVDEEDLDEADDGRDGHLRGFLHDVRHVLTLLECGLTEP